MPFFSNAGPGGFEPKRKFRWTVHFKNLGPDLVFMATKVSKPSVSNESAKHQFLNHEFKFPTQPKWAAVNCTFLDAVEPNTSSKFYNALLNTGYVQPTDFANSLNGVTKVQSVGVLGEIVIRQLDGGSVSPVVDPGELVGGRVAPNIIDEWVLKNAFLTKISFF